MTLNQPTLKIYQQDDLALNQQSLIYLKLYQLIHVKAHYQLPNYS